MEDVRRQDQRLFLREFFSFGRVFCSAVALAFVWFAPFLGPDNLGWTLCATGVVLAIWAGGAASEAKRKRFLNKRFEALYAGCQDRLARFEEVLKRMRKDQVADLREMPETVRRISHALYLALRRADMIAHEIDATEKDLYHAPPAWSASPRDPQSKELYQVADKNIAEYRQQLAGVLAGVQRTEAQSAVYMTTLDTLRMKMLSYRLVGRSPEIPSQDFLEAVNEAKLQLKAIDTALEELELGPYPKMIASMPPPIPDEAAQRIRLGEPPQS